MIGHRRCKVVLALCALSAAFSAAPAWAAHTGFSAPLTGGADFATGFASCNVGGEGGPVGVAFDAAHFFATDICASTTYRTSLSGASELQSVNGLNVGLGVQRGHYYGGSCKRCGSGALVEGVYEFDPATLGVTRTVTTALGSPRAVVADPTSGDIYVSTCSGPNQIYRIQNPDTAPVVTPFGDQSGASDCFDGMFITSDGSTLYVADYSRETVRAYDKQTGAQVLSVALAGHGPDGLALAKANTVLNGVDVSNNVFVNSNDGTIERIDTNAPGNPVSVVASGGSRGDFVTVGPDGCLYATQTDSVEKLSPCFFQQTVVDTTPPSITITTPRDGATYGKGQVVNADYACVDKPGGSGVASCTGDVPSGSAIDTSTTGAHSFTVNAKDNAGNAASQTVHYRVAGPPSVTLTTPPAEATYTLGDTVKASYTCAAGDGGTLQSCTGDAPNGSAIDTSTVGTHTFTVTAKDTDGQTKSVTHSYTVAKAPTQLSASSLVVDLVPGVGLPLGKATATLTSGSAHTPLAGKTVTFAAGGTTQCSAKTSTGGVASCQFTLNGILTSVLSGLHYQAAFAGDAEHLPSATSGPIATVASIKLL